MSEVEQTSHDARAAHRAAYADPYAPLPVFARPATGVENVEDTELLPEDLPVATGTLFIMIIFLMMIGALWAIVYLMLLNR